MGEHSSLSTKLNGGAGGGAWKLDKALLHVESLFILYSEPPPGQQGEGEQQDQQVLARLGAAETIEHLAHHGVVVFIYGNPKSRLLGLAQARYPLVFAHAKCLDGVERPWESDYDSSSSKCSSNGAVHCPGQVRSLVVLPAALHEDSSATGKGGNKEGGEGGGGGGDLVLCCLPADGGGGGGKSAAIPTNGHAPPALELVQRVNYWTEASLEAWGLPPVDHDAENPPLLWPQHFEKDPVLAQRVEARWYDAHHSQLNVILGRGVDTGNVLETLEKAIKEQTGFLASIFATVKYDFGILERMMQDGYRAHHFGKKGTQVVLLKLLTEVEIPTAGTHITRSKAILYRTVPPSTTYSSSSSSGSNSSSSSSGDGGIEVFLFRKRSKPVWKLPGGHVELKELTDAAAVREIREETGFEARIMGLLTVSDRKDVPKKWGCSQLMFTFAAEWLPSDMKLDDDVLREGRWFPVEEIDRLIEQGSDTLDYPLRKSWWTFRAREGWLKPARSLVPESNKRCYVGTDSRRPPGGVLVLVEGEYDVMMRMNGGTDSLSTSLSASESSQLSSPFPLNGT